MYFIKIHEKKMVLNLYNRIKAEIKLFFFLNSGISVRLTGTKYGCGGGGCGACTVRISTYAPASKKIRYP